MAKQLDWIISTQVMKMKNIWIAVLFVLAGCKPEVRESTAGTPPVVPKPEVPVMSAPAPAAPVQASEPVKETPPPKAVVSAEPVKAKPSVEKVVSQTPPVTVTSPAVSVPAPEHAQPAAPVKVEAAPVVVPAAKSQLSEGDALALARKKNCFACHAVDKKVVGPAWKAVAEKYRGDAGAADILKNKIRKGGKGNWGSVAMPAQPALSDEELGGLVQFILQLK